MRIDYYTIRVNTETEQYETIRHTEEGMLEYLKNLLDSGIAINDIKVDETVELKTNKGRTYRLFDEWFWGLTDSRDFDEY